MKKQKKQVIEMLTVFIMSILLMACSPQSSLPSKDYSSLNTYLSSKYDEEFANADQDLAYNMEPKKMGEIYFFNCYLEHEQLPKINKMKKQKESLNLKYNTYVKINGDFMLINENYLSYKGVEYSSNFNEEKKVANICIKNLDSKY